MEATARKPSAGSSKRFGAWFTKRRGQRGINFAVFSTAEKVYLELFRNVTDKAPRRTIRMKRSPHESGTGYVYHIFVPGLENRTLYNFLVNHKRLLDPYARSYAGEVEWDSDGNVHVPRCIAYKDTFEWEGDTPLSQGPNPPSKKDAVIYEVLVGGFTGDPASDCNGGCGKFRGMMAKIPYLKELGVTAVQLMPIFAWDRYDCQNIDPTTGERLTNVWGYNTVGFFALNARMSSLGEQVQEFKLLVRELHKNGIEVILDVVLNHTREGNHLGPTLSFKGLANDVYYMITPDGYYNDWTGCGNTINCNHPVVRQFILDCLRYWVKEFHVDGFRFDLAAVFAVDTDQQEKTEPTPVLREMMADPVLSQVSWWIAEPWGPRQHLLHNGPFSKDRWCRWNDAVRDALRRWVKGDEGVIRALQEAIANSGGDIVFDTCHDGFTRYDLVCNTDKHNVPNGEGNRDGTNSNHSWNCGFEGRHMKGGRVVEAERLAIRQLRRQQMKNLLTLLFVCRGTPMVLYGDETCRSAEGNNNIVFQKKLNQLAWRLIAKYRDMFQFQSRMIAFRKRHQIHHRPIKWHGSTPNSEVPGWSRVLAMTFEPVEGHGEGPVYVVTNSHWEAHGVEMPAPPQGTRWHRLVDTSLPPGQDIVLDEEATPLGMHYVVNARSTVILVAK